MVKIKNKIWLIVLTYKDSRSRTRRGNHQAITHSYAKQASIHHAVILDGSNPKLTPIELPHFSLSISLSISNFTLNSDVRRENECEKMRFPIPFWHISGH